MQIRAQGDNLGSKSVRSQWGWIAFLLLVTLLALIPSIPVLYHTPNTDSSIFIYIGEKIRAGYLPFRDVYDHKPPLIFYLNALGLALGNGSRWGIWVVEFISLSAASLLGFSFLRSYFGSFSSALAVAAMLFNLVTVFERGNMTEEYALPYQFGVLFLLSKFEKDPRPGIPLFGIGVMLGMASTLKQPLAGAGVAVAVYLLLIFLYQRRDWMGLFRSFLLIGLGGIMVWGVWFAYFAIVGILPEFWEAAFQYNFALSGIPPERRFSALVSAVELLKDKSAFFVAAMAVWFTVLPYLVLYETRMTRIITSRLTGIGIAAVGAAFIANGLLGNNLNPENPGVQVWYQVGWVLVGLLLFAAGVVGLRGWGRKRLLSFQQQRPFLVSQGLLMPLLVAFIDFFVAFMLSSLSGNNFSHYFMMLMPAATILIAFLVWSLPRLFRAASGQKMTQVWSALLLLPVFWSGISQTFVEFGPRGDRQVEQVAAYVAKNTQPGDYVLQWGIVPAVNLLSGRDAPTRYFFPDPFFVDGYSGREQTEVLLKELKAHPPVLIVDQRIMRLPLITVPNGESCEKVKDLAYYDEIQKERALKRPGMPIPKRSEGLDEVYYWVCQNYESVGSVGELGWMVYRLKGK